MSRASSLPAWAAAARSRTPWSWATTGLSTRRACATRTECARHKALDCFGDLYLAGAPILGHVRCLRSGHGMNHALLSALMDDRDAWRLVGAEQESGFGDLDREPVAAIA